MTEGDGGGGGVSSRVYNGRGTADGDGGGVGVSPCLGGIGMGSGVVAGEAMTRGDSSPSMVTSPRTCDAGWLGSRSGLMGLTGLDPLSVANAQLASAIVDSKSCLAMATRVTCLATLASLSWVATPPPKGPARRTPSCLSYCSGWSIMVSTRVGEDAREESELLILVCKGVRMLEGLGDENLIVG